MGGDTDLESAMQLTGIHHLTAITANAAGNNRFYTDTLGLRKLRHKIMADVLQNWAVMYI